MALRSLPPRSLPLAPLNPLAQGPPACSFPTLWTQLDPFRRQELAQHLAEMIRCLRVQTHPDQTHPVTERCGEETFDHDEHDQS